LARADSVTILIPVGRKKTMQHDETYPTHGFLERWKGKTGKRSLVAVE
jgi:hypothetical protein